MLSNIANLYLKYMIYVPLRRCSPFLLCELCVLIYWGWQPTAILGTGCNPVGEHVLCSTAETVSQRSCPNMGRTDTTLNHIQSHETTHP